MAKVLSFPRRNRNVVAKQTQFASRFKLRAHKAQRNRAAKKMSPKRWLK